MNKIFSFLGLVCASACMLLISACEKDDNEAFLDSLVGDYELEEIYWTGTRVDIDGNRNGSRTLLNEFKGMSGFVEEWTYGTVVRNGSSHLIYSTAIPAYTAIMSDGEVQYCTIEYYGISLNVGWIADESRFSTEEELMAVPETNKKGLVCANLKNIRSDYFEIFAECYIYDEKNDCFRDGCMIFSFQKK